MSNADHLLPISLSIAVPLALADYRRRGGPTDDDWDRARAFGQELAERGDRLLYTSPKGETAEMFTKLVNVLAILAHVPGGVRAFGLHFEVRR